MTNDGELLNQMMRSANDHEKEYIVSLDKVINEEFLLGMQNGVYLEELEVTTKKCKVEKLSDTWRFYENQTVSDIIQDLGYCGYVALEKNVNT